MKKNLLINRGRRDALKKSGGLLGAGVLIMAGLATTHARLAKAAYTLTPTTTEGPFFVDEMLNRRDIREDRTGVVLDLALTVSQLKTGGSIVPVKGAQIDIWHCDAGGDYSDVNSGIANTCGSRFLRGYQITNSRGIVKFRTIFPGWYSGRTVHIHCNLRTFDGEGSVTSAHQTQLFFDETLIAKVYARAPYLTRTGSRDTFNSNDSILQNVANTNLLMARSSYSNTRVVSAAHLIIDPTDAGHTASVSTLCTDGGGKGPGGIPPNGRPPPGSAAKFKP
jgi:protocatechuate 3,4-dioxygenase beta subunit